MSAPAIISTSSIVAQIARVPWTPKRVWVTITLNEVGRSFVHVILVVAPPIKLIYSLKHCVTA